MVDKDIYCTKYKYITLLSVVVTTASVVGPAPPLEEAYTVQEYSVDGSRWLSVKVRMGLSWT